MSKGIYKRTKTPWNKGKTGIFSQETLKKISDGVKNNPARYWKGKHLSEKHRQKIGLAGIGHKRSLGYKHSEETKRKMAERMKGNTYNTGKKHRFSPTEEHRKKIAITKIGQKRLDITGEKHPRWIKDRTKLKRDDKRADSAYGEWQRQIYVRDKKCKMADENCAGRLECHHIFGWTLYPELRYVISNGILLCHFHHPRKKLEEKRLIPYFQSLLT